MKKPSKRIRAIPLNQFESNENSIDFVIKNANAKFNESIDLCVKLGINVKKSNENVRGTVKLPFGIKKNLKVVVFTNDPQIALKHGAYKAGLEDLIAEIKGGNLDADICLSTIEVFQKLIPIAPILGKARLMPNNKDKTVVTNVEKSLHDILSGSQVSFKNDSAGYVHLCIGKANFSTSQIKDNIKAALKELESFQTNNKKVFFEKITISSTMGKSALIDFKKINT